MMRISREEEHYIGRARTGMVGRAKVGFRKDGRITALDLFIVEDNGPYGPMGDHRSAGNAASLIWQPLAMRWRGVAVITNTPPRRSSGRRAPMQGNGIIEPSSRRPRSSWDSIRWRSDASTRRRASAVRSAGRSRRAPLRRRSPS